MRFRKSLAVAGVGIFSILPLYRWARARRGGPAGLGSLLEAAIQIASLLGVDTMNSEFNGNPREAAVCERMFWRSMDELLPCFREGGHPARARAAPRRLGGGRQARRRPDQGHQQPDVSFLYCAPHTFHQGNDCVGIMEKAGDLLTMVHVADSFDHTGSSGLRYIVNPPGSQVTIHQHLDIGQGEVDFDEFFATSSRSASTAS